jgi:Ca2+-binding RTX toxin-like protein
MPTVPWRQATPGGVWQEEQLLSIGFDASDSNAANWKSILHTIDPDTQVATKVREFGEFEARDLAAPAAGVIFITGTARSGPAIGTHRLWRYDTVTQALVDLGQTPGIAPLVGFDALDDATLIGTNNDGIFLYDIATARWTAKGAILTQDDVRYYPVGDVAVAGARKVWAIAVPQKPDNPGAAVDQALVLLDPTVEVGNATLVRLLRTNNGATTISDTEPVIGLETNPLGGLFGLTRSERLYAIETAVGGGSTWLGNKQVTNLPDLSAGGLAWMPGGLVPDFGRDEFVITVSAGQTVTIGFGDVPDAVLLHDGDDFIDGGCGDDVDALHGDDGDDLPANVITEGGKDWIRGRGGNDWIAGGQRGDRLFGDEGDDRIFGGATEPNWIDGGDGNDSQLYGGAAADVILGGAGNDADIRGGGGDDRVFGGAGNDVLRGGTGDDTLVGGAGFDMVFGEAGDDTLVVIDALSGGEYAANPAGTKPDAYDGGGDTDTIVVSANADTDLSDVDVMLYGVTHAIARIEIGLLTGGKDGNTIDAAAFSGATAIRGLGGKDTLRGGSAGDRIFGGDGDDTITGNGDNDFLYGDAGIDTIHGNAGIDRIEGERQATPSLATPAPTSSTAATVKTRSTAATTAMCSSARVTATPSTGVPAPTGSTAARATTSSAAAPTTTPTCSPGSSMPWWWRQPAAAPTRST